MPTTPVEKIVELLVSAGYRRLVPPLTIVGLSFEVPAALVGTGAMSDLIVVADTAFETDQRIQKKLEGIARALDVARSKRPLTAVLAGPRPRTPVLDAMSKVCRVLPVGTVVDRDQDAALKNWLAVLMPLSLPQARGELADPMKELSRQVDTNDAVSAELMSAAPLG